MRAHGALGRVALHGMQASHGVSAEALLQAIDQPRGSRVNASAGH